MCYTIAQTTEKRTGREGEAVRQTVLELWERWRLFLSQSTLHTGRGCEIVICQPFIFRVVELSMALNLWCLLQMAASVLSRTQCEYSSLIHFNSPMYLLGLFVWSTRRKSIWPEADWLHLLRPWGPFFVLTVQFTRMFKFSTWLLYCSPDVLNEQEEEGLVSGGLLAVLQVNPIQRFPGTHKTEWEGDRAFWLKGNVLSHIQQTTTWWLISGSVQQWLHSHPAVLSSDSLRIKIAEIHWAQWVFSRSW